MTKERPEPENHLSDHLEENPAIVWVSRNGSNLLYGLLVCVLALLIMARYGWIGSPGSGTEYIESLNQYAIFTKDPSSEAGKNALNSLSSLLNKYPRLQSKYDSLIAQQLLTFNSPEEAAPYLTRALNRTTDKSLPLYASFAKNSLLIEQKKYEEALQNSITLRDQINDEQSNDKFGSVLDAFNLLRIAILQQQLGKEEAERKTWLEWEQIAKDKPTYEQIKKLFVQGHVGLDSFIRSRTND